MSRFRPISAPQIARMTFALAAGMLLALVALANSAQAGCGDYVFVRNASGQLVRASTLMQGHATARVRNVPTTIAKLRNRNIKRSPWRIAFPSSSIATVPTARTARSCRRFPFRPPHRPGAYRNPPRYCSK